MSTFRYWRKFSIALLLSFLFLWGSGLAWFARLIPAVPTSDASATDAIVVLTGGSLRLERGFELLSAGRARKMFISGVETGLTLADLLRNKEYRPFADALPQDAVTLGHAAHSTIGNAVETAGWVAREHIASIRLVTGNYHMPRSIYELREATPTLIIVPEPVFPAHFAHSAWWRHGDSVLLVISEYHKFMATVIAHRLLSES